MGNVTKKPIFPFTAILNQDTVKLALLLNIIEPNIGGVLVFGDRGTGKSTTIRSVKELLPMILSIKNDPFNSAPTHDAVLSQNIITHHMPMLELPLGVTEEHVCGTLNIDKAFTEGVRQLEPGLLAKANRGILYVDEINLLEDKLIDLLLDAAACGWSTVERDGISVEHPAKFILFGSGNLEEHDLRPQFVDRFGMCVESRAAKNFSIRTEILRQRILFDENPSNFREAHFSMQEALRTKISKAIALLSKVIISKDHQDIICHVCTTLNLCGVRGDLATIRAAKAHAAFEGRDQVLLEDIDIVIGMCLCHRLKHGIYAIGASSQKVRDALASSMTYL